MDSQLIWIIVVAVIGFANWVIQKSAEAKERQRQEEESVQRLEDGLGSEETLQEPEPAYPLSRRDQSGEDQEESMRRLMDALGLPSESTPPPLPPQRPAVIARSEPLVSAWPPPMRAVKSEVIPGAEALAQRFQQSTRPQAAVKANLPSGVREMLARPSSLRDAIILREILGPPKALS